MASQLLEVSPELSQFPPLTRVLNLFLPQNKMKFEERERGTLHFLEQRLVIEFKLPANLMIGESTMSLEVPYNMCHFLVSLCLCVKTNLCPNPRTAIAAPFACLFSWTDIKPIFFL